MFFKHFKISLVMKARDGVDDDFGRPIVSSQLHTMHNLVDMFASKILLQCRSTKISAGGWHVQVDCSVWTIVLDAYGWPSPLFSVGLPRYMSKGNHAPNHWDYFKLVWYGGRRNRTGKLILWAEEEPSILTREHAWNEYYYMYLKCQPSWSADCQFVMDSKMAAELMQL
jgi:hypothetical protein